MKPHLFKEFGFWTVKLEKPGHLHWKTGLTLKEAMTYAMRAGYGEPWESAMERMAAMLGQCVQVGRH